MNFTFYTVGDIMKIEKNSDYTNIINRHAPSSPTLKNCFFAFLVGGFLCFVGEWIAYFLMLAGLEETNAYLTVTVIYILGMQLN